MTNSSTSSSSIHQNVVPSEVGWQFVPQYYTFVNKQPNRLHCFYTKASTFIHGTEGEDGKPCYGQHEIHQKITSIGFQDCKVFIHSVDAQSSANGGIIIQVIGEMSNHGDPWRKFVQTFFLAEQPNGYFVLNDIFRFLKEETIESDDASEIAEADAAPVTPASEPAPTPAIPAPAPEPVYEPPREPTPPPVAPISAAVTPSAIEEVPAAVAADPPVAQIPTPAPEAPAPVSVPVAQTNGIHTPEPDKPVSAPIADKSPAPTPAPQQPPAASVPIQSAIPVASTSAPAPSVAPTAPPQTAAPTPAPATSTAPRSWASLAASNPKKWGSAVAPDSRGTTEVPVTASPGPGSGAQTPSGSGPSPSVRTQQHHHQSGQGKTDHPMYVAAQNVSTAQCFVKGVAENLTQIVMATNLTQRFGPIKELEIVRSKACAFLEFNTVDAARRAIIASLPPNQGGEGGVWIDVGGDVGQVRISIETKKERGERPVNRPRGGAPMMNGEGRGSGGSGGGSGGYNRRSGVGRGGRGTGSK